MPADKKQLSKLKFQSQAEMRFKNCQAVKETLSKSILSQPKSLTNKK